jgi:uncharacterized protein
LVWKHSVIVATVAEQLRTSCSHLTLDSKDVMTASLVHDIGVYKCIDWVCRFERDMSKYIRHGIVGGRILRYEGFSEDVARVAEQHTGVGITKRDICEQALELPIRDYVPETVVEGLICYADKFHSKNLRFLTLEEAISAQQRWGADKVKRLLELKETFGVPDLEPIRAKYEPWQQAFGSSARL